MNEQEWLASNDPMRMLECLTSDDGWPDSDELPRPSDRKLRLFTCAWWRKILPHSFSHQNRVQEVEDGDEFDMAAVIASCRDCCRQVPTFAAAGAALLRDIIGNPFRLVVYPCCEGVRRIERVPGDATTLIGGECPAHGRTYHLRGADWLSPTVLDLAEAAYQERKRERVECPRCAGWSIGRLLACPECDNRGSVWTTDGTLDQNRLLVLADAMEEAGCVDAAILGHLREEKATIERLEYPGGSGSNPAVIRERRSVVHVRGCWVLDLILGKG